MGNKKTGSHNILNDFKTFFNRLTNNILNGKISEKNIDTFAMQYKEITYQIYKSFKKIYLQNKGKKVRKSPTVVAPEDFLYTDYPTMDISLPNKEPLIKSYYFIIKNLESLFMMAERGVSKNTLVEKIYFIGQSFLNYAEHAGQFIILKNANLSFFKKEPFFNSHATERYALNNELLPQHIKKRKKIKNILEFFRFKDSFSHFLQNQKKLQEGYNFAKNNQDSLLQYMYQKSRRYLHFINQDTQLLKVSDKLVSALKQETSFKKIITNVQKRFSQHFAARYDKDKRKDNIISLSEVTLLSIDFKNKCSIYDKKNDLSLGGKKYKKIEWKRGEKQTPFAVLSGEHFELDIIVKIDGKNIIGKKGVFYFKIDEFELYGMSRPGELEPVMHLGENIYKFKARSHKALPKKVAKIKTSMKWAIKIYDKNQYDKIYGEFSGCHFFLLKGKTRLPNFYFKKQPTGFPFKKLKKRGYDGATINSFGWGKGYTTHARLSHAIEIINKAIEINNCDSLHSIVSYIHSLFPKYRLSRDLSVDPKYDQPTLFYSSYGAWSAMKFQKTGLECQAIIRFIKAVIDIVGYPGKAEIVHVSADPHSPYKAITNKNLSAWTVEDEKYFIFGDQIKSFYALADSKIKKYLKPGQKIKDMPLSKFYKGPALSLNNFEATLKVTENNKTLFYGGGAGIYQSEEEVLNKCFHSLVCVEINKTKQTASLEYKYLY